MKIGIFTILDNVNYGNRLQNFALVKYLQRKFHANVVTLNNESFYDYSYVSVINRERIQKTIRKMPMLKQLVNMVRRHRDSKDPVKLVLAERKKNFDKFNRENIVISFYKLTEFRNTYEELMEFDFFITGSDQVWNPFFGRANRNDFLRFAPPCKRIAYAASFGISEYPAHLLKQLEIFLNGMSRISVRENTGKELVEKYSEQRAEVVVDPVFLLSQDEWGAFEKKPDAPLPKRYCLLYFLGRISNEQNRYIERQARAKELEIIGINHTGYLPFYVIDPKEFVYLIHHAVLIFTDSFHASALSIIFNKQFLVFERHEYYIYSRLKNLLDKYHLEQCAVQDLENEKIPLISAEEYTSINRLVRQDVILSQEWLESALKEVHGT